MQLCNLTAKGVRDLTAENAKNAKDAQDCFTRIFTNLHQGGKDLSQEYGVKKMKTDLKLFSEMILSFRASGNAGLSKKKDGHFVFFAFSAVKLCL